MPNRERGRRAMKRAAKIATAAAAGVPAFGLVAPQSANAAGPPTFNISLIGEFAPPRTGTGSNNNIYSDLWADGDVVVIGSVNSSTALGRGVSIIDNSNPAA